MPESTGVSVGVSPATGVPFSTGDASGVPPVCRRALEQTGDTRLVIAGGVGANRKLRARLADAAQRDGFRVYFPRLEFCTDNGAMIAFAGALRLAAGQHEAPAIKVQPRWDLASLPPVA